MKVSMVFAVWNRCFSAYTCLENIFANQGLDPAKYEFILVEDDSVDNSLEVLEHFKNKYRQYDIKIIQRRNDETLKYTNNGVIKNYGVKHATGDVIFTVDVETYFLFKGMIDELANLAYNDHQTLFTPSFQIMEVETYTIYRALVHYFMQRDIPVFDDKEDLENYFHSSCIGMSNDPRITGDVIIRGEMFSRYTEESFLRDKEELLRGGQITYKAFKTPDTIGLCHVAHKDVWTATGGWSTDANIWFEWGGAEFRFYRKLLSKKIRVKKVDSLWVSHIGHQGSLPDITTQFAHLRCELGGL